MALRISSVDASYKRVKDTMTSQRTPYNLRASATDDRGVCTTTLVRARGTPCIVGDLTARLWRPYCAAMVRGYGDPTALLLERRATAFVLSMLKVRAVARRSSRSHSVYWRCHCTAVMLAIVLRAFRRSAFF